MSLKKYATMMSYEISDSEKEIAEKAIRYFDYCQKTLKGCWSHLNLIYDAFKDDQTINPEDLFKRRAALRRYRDKVVDNFNYLKRIAFKCYVVMQPFISDTQTERILKSFVSIIEELEDQVNKLIEIFGNLKSKDFAKDVITAINSIKPTVEELTELIDDRMKNHIQKNILSRNWVSELSKKLQEKVEKKSPLLVELVKEREEALKLNKNI